MDIQVYSAFTLNEQGGNLAGVVWLNAPLSDAEKISIAKAVGYSETAFIEKSLIADFKITFFTPVAEVDLCGHATVAAFSYLFQTQKISSGVYVQETKAGLLSVEIKPDGMVVMEQSEPIFYEAVDFEAIRSSLNLKADDYDAVLPCKIVSTGVRDLLIPLKSKRTLSALQPNFDAISKLSEKYNITGYHVFVLNTDIKEDYPIAFCRNFAPFYGIDEEAATGTSSGALAALLYTNNLRCKSLEEGGYFTQGESMAQTSKIWVKCHRDTKLSVKVGGYAISKGTVSVSIK